MIARINDKKYRLLSIRQMTVEQYKNLVDVSGEQITIESYLRYITNNKDFSFLNIDNTTFTLISKMVFSDFPDFNKEVCPTTLILGKKIFRIFGKQRKFEVQKINYDRVGVRLLYYENEKYYKSVIEKNVYWLALALSKDFETDEVNELYHDLMQTNVVDALAVASFFLRSGQSKLKFILNNCKRRAKKSLSVMNQKLYNLLRTLKTKFQKRKHTVYGTN